MKIKSALTLIALLLAQSAAAVPLLEKNTIPGFMMIEYAVSKSCVIHRSGTLINSQSLGGLSSSRSTALKLNFPAIKTVIDHVALGSITTGIAPVDGGRVEYYAYQLQPNGTLKKVVIWENGEGSSNTNNALEAKLLRNFIDLTCGDPLSN